MLRMTNLTVSEIRSKRANLESDIREMVCNFQHETGCAVQGIEVGHEPGPGDVGQSVTTVTVSISID